jgi:beta-glucosidase
VLRCGADLRLVPSLALLALAACAPARTAPPAPLAPRPALLPFQDPDLPLETRLTSLVSLLTLDEKVAQLQSAAPAIPRLGIPAYDWWSEGLHGVARSGPATVFPQAIGLAATWDTALMFRVATAIATEARAKHHEALRLGRHGIYEGLTFWSPNINIFRDPRWGRGMETYGEDPFLTGRLAVAFVRGMQGDDPRYLRVVATPKHYAVHSGPEGSRHGFDALVSEHDLWDTYLPAFEAAVVEGGAWSVMCAYNRVDGTPACGSRRLLQEILRDGWRFPGYVVSDCDAVDDMRAGHRLTADSAEAAAMGLRAGTDLNCGRAYAKLGDAVRGGLVGEPDVDTSLARLLRARFRLGMFDPPERVPYAATPIGENESPAHRALALEAARESIVLLANGGGLPLRRDLRTIAVIGPSADDEDLLLGNYNGIPREPVTPLEGIRRKVVAIASGGGDAAPGAGGGGATQPGARRPAEVVYAQGSDWAPATPVTRVVPSSALFADSSGRGPHGLTGAYFATHDFTGAPVATRIDPALDFTWWEEPPLPGVPADSFSIRWTGTLVAPVSGRYALGLRGLGGATLVLDDSTVVRWSDRHVVLTEVREVDLVAGQPRRIRVEYFDRRPFAGIQLVWAVPRVDLQAEAVAAARRADAVVLVLGLSPRLEGEEMPVRVPGFDTGDRTDLQLPAPQEALLEAVVATGKPVTVVLLSGSALGVSWAAEHAGALLEAWYPGQAAGTAIADVLFGDANPAGRLPVTFYRSVEQLPPFADYRMEGRTYRYFRGDVLFPFGHGLSYTRFRYRDLVVAGTARGAAPSASGGAGAPVPTLRAGDRAEVSVEIENAGSVAGEEVVQLYVGAVDAAVSAPVRSLAGFRRVLLQPGERRRVAFTLGPRALSLVDGAGQRSVVPGTYEIGVGGKQPGFRGLADAATTEVLTARLRVTGERLEIPR